MYKTDLTANIISADKTGFIMMASQFFCMRGYLRFCFTQAYTCIFTALYLRRVVRKSAFAYAKTKTQISFAISFAVTVKLISPFIFATRIVQTLYFLNFRPLAIFYRYTAWFVSDLMKTPKTGFLRTRLMYGGLPSFEILHIPYFITK